MLTVQGSFVPWGHAGFFFLFALDLTQEAGAWPRGGLHPAAVPADRLLPILRGFPTVHAVTASVHLPGGRSLQLAKVPGLALPPAHALQWLLDLDAAFDPARLAPGQSLRAWSAASKLLLELLGRGRLLPFLQREAGCLVAGWQLCAPEQEDARRLAQLADALPDICRAIVPPDRNARSYQPPAAHSLLALFMQRGAQELAHAWLQDAPQRPADSGPAPGLQRWLQALVGRARPEIPEQLPGTADLAQALAGWAKPALGVQHAGALRAGLRLLQPKESPNSGWEVELILQTAQDPPLTLPATAVWAALGEVLEIDGQRFAHAEQSLLADLPAMARLFAPLQPLCNAARPAALALTPAAVLELLHTGAMALQEAGYPVLLPANLVRGGGVKARLHVAAPASGAGAFGLQQIVQVDWELALRGVPISYAELKELARQKQPLIQHAGRWVQVDPARLTAALKGLESQRHEMSLLQVLRLSAQRPTEPATAPPPQTAPTPQPEPDAPPLQVTEVTSDGWVAEMLERLAHPARIQTVPVPGDFRGQLRPYQQRGLDWLDFLIRHGLGACLADDMGLGKTVQLIALLLAQRARGNGRPVLLVCPVSLIGNWRREIARFAPELRVLIHHGTGRQDGAFTQAAQAHDVVLTTYALLGRDASELAAVPWAGLIADEAQNIKNPHTRPAQALHRLPGGFRIALTGTPVENHLGDLWALFAFLNPGLLGSYEEFRRTFALPIERYRDPEATARLRRLVGPFLLRRLKTDPALVPDLPEKLETTVVASMSLEQAALYEAVVQEMLERVEDARGIARHGAVLAGLTRLKLVCNHPALLRPDGPLVGQSGKLDCLVEILEEVLAAGEAALIFTQFSRFGFRLREELARRLDCPVLFLSGELPAAERDRAVAQFQAGAAPLFVLSLKAGGVGLNLTAASHVLHVDRWWNPAIEDQATDRAFRLGQTRRVLVHKLITAGTLEERIDRLLTEKRALSQEIIDTGEAWLGNLSTDELRNLILLERE